MLGFKLNHVSKRGHMKSDGDGTFLWNTAQKPSQFLKLNMDRNEVQYVMWT